MLYLYLRSNFKTFEEKIFVFHSELLYNILSQELFVGCHKQKDRFMFC